MAVFLSNSAAIRRASYPIAVLYRPVVSAFKAYAPIAIAPSASDVTFPPPKVAFPIAMAKSTSVAAPKEFAPIPLSK